jgi:hypothetical protein
MLALQPPFDDGDWWLPEDLYETVSLNDGVLVE